MDINRNIKDLLYRYDCVILPGFGGFLANYTPAAIDYDRNIFGPPSKKISFNSQLIHNDGLLISSVSTSSGLGYKDARKIVETFIQDARDQLNKGKRLEFDGLGTFFNGNDKTLRFEPDESVNYLSHSFGFSTFEFDQLEEFDVRKKIRSRFKGITPTDRNRRNKVIRRAVIAIPVLIALTLVPLKTNLFKSLSNTTSLGPVKNSEPGEEVIENKMGEIQDHAADENAVYVVPEEASLPEPKGGESEDDAISLKKPLVSPSGSYYVIAGSFKNQDNAFRLQSNLRGQGYSGEIFNTDTGFFRVALNGYETYSEAKSALRTYEIQNPVEKYWILKK